MIIKKRCLKCWVEYKTWDKFNTPQLCLDCCFKIKFTNKNHLKLVK